MLAKMRKLILSATPRSSRSGSGPSRLSHDGIICTGESYKSVIKLTFAKGAAVKDPKRLFNSSLEGNVRRAIDIREGDKIDEAAFKTLVRGAVMVNLEGGTKPKPRRTSKR
jgi:hypothetical protein